LHELGPHVHSVFIFNTQISFDELLRLALEDLGLPRNSNDRITLIETLNQYLIGRLKEGDITCLLIDEAQNLSAETLEGLRLLSNLETDKEKLLQIVLMGQPELEKTIEQPTLRQLKQRVALHCRLTALEKPEVGSYIDSRLKAAGYEGHRLFSASAVDRIAFYSEGVPRLINIICDNALLTTYALSQKEVSADIIKEVAFDLRLPQPRQFQTGELQTEILQKQNGTSPDAESKIVPDDVWRSRLEHDRMPSRVSTTRAEVTKKSETGFRVGAFLTLVLFGGAGALMYSQQGRKYISHVGTSVEDLIEHRLANNPPAEKQQEIRSNSTPKQAPASSPQPVVTENTYSDLPSVPENSPGVSPNPVPNKSAKSKAREAQDEKRSVLTEQPPARLYDSPQLQRKRVELAIKKAIQNRAITGVAVSFIEGTVYLDGEVASERQKSMADRAARSVADAKDVRNRLQVKRFSE
jgi:type II secretory pathway predicted ATPase ExeA